MFFLLKKLRDVFRKHLKLQFILAVLFSVELSRRARPPKLYS